MGDQTMVNQKVSKPPTPRHARRSGPPLVLTTPPPRWCVQIPLIAVIYYVVARLALLLAFQHTNASPVWPPSGLAFAALLLWGPEIWPGIFLGAWLANVAEFFVVPAHTVAPWLVVLVSAVIGAGNTLEAVAGWWLLRRVLGPHPPFDRVQDVVRFVGVAIVTGTIAPAIGPLAIVMAGLVPWSLYGPMWLTWWLGDTTGILVVTPWLLSWSRPVSASWSGRHLGEGALLVAAVLLVGRVGFGGWLPSDAHYPLEFLAIPVLLWAVFRFGRRAGTTSVVVIAGMAVWDTVHGVGPFVRATVNESLLLLQVFVGVVVVTVLVLLAILNERRQAWAQLRLLADTLEQRVTERTRDVQQANLRLQQMADIVEASDDAMISKTLDGVITSWNRGAERLFGYTASEIVGQPITRLLPPGRPNEEPGILRRIRQGISVKHYETVRQRKDGQRLAVSLTVSPIRQADGTVIGGAEIARDVTDRKRLEQELLAISEREQQRIGQDLHDGLGQHLLGIAFLGKHLHGKLVADGVPEAAEVAQMTELIHQTIPQIRQLAEGLYPGELQAEGLAPAIRQLAAKAEQMTGVPCLVEEQGPLPPLEGEAALHLYRITQEAINNAIRHGQARRVTIRLAAEDGQLLVTIRDDGVGLPEEAEGHKGLGLRIMSYRAGMIGALLEVGPDPAGGTVVTCLVPGRRAA